MKKRVKFDGLSIQRVQVSDESVIDLPDREFNLPGHPEGPSDALKSLLVEAEATTGRPLRVRDITLHPLEPARGMPGGTDSSGVWVSGELPKPIAEAVLAHEVMHLFQAIQGWQMIGLTLPPSPDFRELHDLGGAISSAVLNPQADSWAVERGFDIAGSLRWQLEQEAGRVAENSALDEDLARDTIGFMWRRLADQLKDVRNGRSPKLTIPVRQIVAITKAVDYLDMSLRVGNLGMEFTMDAEWASSLPSCRQLGLELRSIVNRSDLKTKKGTEASLAGIYQRLGLRASLFKKISSRSLLERGDFVA